MGKRWKRPDEGDFGAPHEFSKYSGENVLENGKDESVG